MAVSLLRGDAVFDTGGAGLDGIAHQRLYEAPEEEVDRQQRRQSYSKELKVFLLWYGDTAELLHHAQIVSVDPVICHLPIDQAQNVNLRHREMLAGWGNAQKVSPVGAAQRATHNHLIPIGDYLLNRRMLIAKGALEHSDHSFETFSARPRPRS